MLPLRLAMFAALFGVALTGLFSLLDNLSEPELLRSKSTVIVKGCNPIEGEDAARLCPQLFCQKFLLDARTIGPRARFEVTVDQRSGEEHLIGGIARPFPAAQQKMPQQSFACLMEHGEVIAGRVLEPMELEELSAQTATWSTLADSGDDRR